MKKKLGFTLVELLAVIVILAVILIIAMPKISDVIKNSREASLETTAKLIASQAEKKKMEKEILEDSEPINCSDIVKLNDTDYGSCKITFDDKGNASVILNGKKDSKFDNLTCSGTKDNITCSEGETSIYKKCTTSDTLKYGLKFFDGQYTYTYNGSTGWKVVLTDMSSTEPVTTELCSTINDKPIVDMNRMFQNSKATSIDVSSFDTSNVTSMNMMFYFSAATEIKGLEKFNTSKVTNMGGMFQNSKATSIDVSSFDTSKVTNMGGMFAITAVTSLDLSSFDTSNVTNMVVMFSNAKATIGYARTCEDATRLNASSDKPSGLTFIVKDTTC